nr:MAG TPA: hypothetical protein [Caudoviricetes sp.]
MSQCILCRCFCICFWFFQIFQSFRFKILIGNYLGYGGKEGYSVNASLRAFAQKGVFPLSSFRYPYLSLIPSSNVYDVCW